MKRNELEERTCGQDDAIGYDEEGASVLEHRVRYYPCYLYHSILDVPSLIYSHGTSSLKPEF